MPFEEFSNSVLQTLRINARHVFVVGIKFVIKMSGDATKFLTFNPTNPKGMLHYGKVKWLAFVHLNGFERAFSFRRSKFSLRTLHKASPFANGLFAGKFRESNRQPLLAQPTGKPHKTNGINTKTNQIGISLDPIRRNA